jgi:hypothetical protein
MRDAPTHAPIAEHRGEFAEALRHIEKVLSEAGTSRLLRMFQFRGLAAGALSRLRR